MKKILLFVLSIVVCGTSHAQLVVNAAGKVAVATDSVSHSNLTVGGVGSSSSDVYVHQKSIFGLTIKNNYNSFSSPSSGVRIDLRTNDSQAEGVLAEIRGNQSNHVRALEGRAYGGRYNVGVWGAIEHIDEMTSGAGVFGALTGYPIAFNGIYAGYFYGDVKVEGGLYATCLTSTSYSTSSPSYSMLHEDDDQSVLDRLADVDLLQINRSESADRMEEENVPGMTELHEISYGLAADQLEKEFPELVYKDDNGNVSINYVEMVPLLVQSINELQQKVKILEGEKGVKQVVNKEKLTTGIDDLSEVLSMSQNNPNPFHESTTISLNIPPTIANADLCIYDLTGKQIRKIRISDRGEAMVTITSSGLTPGMYIYALIADGQVISTKRMILN